MELPMKDFIDDYLSQDCPEYAILLSGPWGVGKSFQVKQCIDSPDALFVSLFGIRSTEEAHGAVLAQLFSTIDTFKKYLGDTDSSVINSMYFGVFSAAKSIANHWLSNQISKKHIIIFDDLERCEMTIKEMMSVFSRYLDAYHCRVILIASEDDFNDELDDFQNAKEKIVGRTYQVESQTEQAYCSFSSQFQCSNEVNFLNQHKTLILSIFSLSDCHSLRVLRQMLFGLVKLFHCLDKLHLENASAIREVVSLYCALEIEIQMGYFSVHDIMGMHQAITKQNSMKRNTKELNSKSKNVNQTLMKYSSYFSLYSIPLSEDVLYQIFAHRKYDDVNISKSLSNSRHFRRASQLPPWKVLIRLQYYDDNDIRDAIWRLEHRFEHHDATDCGEMLHVFCARLLFANEIGKCFSEIESECCDYIDFVQESGKLGPKDELLVNKRNWLHEYDQMVYYVTPAYQEFFDRIVDHMKLIVDRAIYQWCFEISEKIVFNLENNVEELYYEFDGLIGEIERSTWRSAVTMIQPLRFVRSWLKGPSKHWEMVLNMIFGLLSTTGNYQPSTELINWVKFIVEELEKASNSKIAYNSVRIHQLVFELNRQLSRISNEMENSSSTTKR